MFIPEVKVKLTTVHGQITGNWEKESYYAFNLQGINMDMFGQESLKVLIDDLTAVYEKMKKMNEDYYEQDLPF